jgi:hypothetical protein
MGRAVYGQINRWKELALSWNKNWDRSKLHVIFYEDLVRDTKSQVERLAQFLDVRIDQESRPGLRDGATGARI